MTLKNILLLGLCLPLLAASCDNKTSTNRTETDSLSQSGYMKVSPDFNSDSAYYFVNRQVAFGSRIPNSEAHQKCGDFLVNELKRLEANVTEQKIDLKSFDGTVFHARNIIGSYDIDNPNRLLLFAHWDSRMYADQDLDESKHNEPVLGANDGASGVGVLLEIARQVQKKSPNLGVDIIFFDAEDNGAPDYATNVPEGLWWCLGSQYWSKKPHISNYKARFGILLDMVGADGATFYKEAFSIQNAMNVVDKIWRTARDLGYGRFFVDAKGGSIMDDHVPVVQNLQIPCVDIIHFDPKGNSGFGWYWHTSRDDMNSISKVTLKAVGQTVLEVLYKEK